ncbi:uncharacterized protein [Lepeophtheirus salmonis]|uniref:Uncharacterized protein n=1 Tax=Lepeophtheirus salmonis TaxID=72036 RepID=A0A0K2TRL7_LEPSM|nr:uncharacterized protein LOC121114351 [Lepeophtheirus salmonis]
MFFIYYIAIILVNISNQFIYAQHRLINKQSELFARVRETLPSLRNQEPLNYKEDFLERSVPLSQMEDSYIPYRETDDQLDYDEFPEIPPFLQIYSRKNLGEASYQKEPVFQKPHQKRYLGIDIPDYISNGGKANAIKNMSNKMKAVG